ncbi:unnamed protein product, partial [Coregonus sp. 'balchen']
MPRVQDDKLHIVLDTLRFYQIFITCHLKAVPAMFAVNSRNRACSFIENRYEIQMGHPASYGNNQAYRSCEVSKRFEEPTEAPMTTPTTINTKRPITPKLNPASFFRVRPGQRREQLPIQKPLLWHVEKGNGHKGRWVTHNTKPIRGNLDALLKWSKTTILGPLIIVPTQEVIILEMVSTTTLRLTTILVETVDSSEAVHPKELPEAMTVLPTEPVGISRGTP